MYSLGKIMGTCRRNHYSAYYSTLHYIGVHSSTYDRSHYSTCFSCTVFHKCWVANQMSPVLLGYEKLCRSLGRKQFLNQNSLRSQVLSWFASIIYGQEDCGDMMEIFLIVVRKSAVPFHNKQSRHIRQTSLSFTCFNCVFLLVAHSIFTCVT